MFEKFGEMDSYKEINDLAEAMFNEGDLESIKILAEETEYRNMQISTYPEIYLTCVMRNPQPWGN